MDKQSTRALRRIAIASILPFAALAASCAPDPVACPTLSNGDWSGTWSSELVPGIGGDVDATLTSSGASVGGSFAITGSVFVGPAPITGTIACDQIQVTATSGVTLTGTVAPTGDSISGAYTSSSPTDSGSFAITAD